MAAPPTFDYPRRLRLPGGVAQGVVQKPVSLYSTLFDGVNESVNLGNVPELAFDRLDPFSISAWFKTTSAGSGLSIFTKQNWTGTKSGYRTHYKDTDRLSAELHNDISTNRIIIEYIHAVNLYRDGEWHHLAMTYDGSSAAAGVVLYIDTSVQTPTVVADNLTATITNSIPASIGSRGNTLKFFDGNLDDIGVWDKELTAFEVSQIYNSGTPNDLLDLPSSAGNLVGYWRMGDGDTFPTLIDHSVSGNDGTMLNMEAGDIVLDAPP